jgi:hypothetical protein
LNIIDRFKNQRISQLIHLKNRVSGQFPRICNCLRLKNKRSAQVSLRKKEGAAVAHYGDLQTCGSVWVCPVCGSIITEGRAEIVQTAINNWRDMSPDNCVIMITFTTPHYLFQPLSEVLSIQDKAMRIMKKQPQRGLYTVYRTIVHGIGSIGNYTGRELTWGQLNGWHPHRHVLFFCKRQNIAKLRRLQFDLTIAWIIAFKKAGGEIRNIEHFSRRAIKVDQITDDDGYTRISRYITTVEGETWTLAKEATKGPIKIAKNGNITPFGMLDVMRHGRLEVIRQGLREGIILGELEAILRDPLLCLYSRKFYEYACTMKGKKQFFGSPGLADKLGVREVSDKDILEEKKTGNHYSFLSDPDWQIIIENELRGEIRELTRDVNEFEFMDLLDEYLKDFKKISA